MEQKRYTDEQIASTPRQTEAGTPTRGATFTFVDLSRMPRGLNKCVNVNAPMHDGHPCDVCVEPMQYPSAPENRDILSNAPSLTTAPHRVAILSEIRAPKGGPQ
jgi:hypothetical protein